MSRTERERAPSAFQLRSSLDPASTATPRDRTAAERQRRFRARHRSDEILASSIPLPRKVVEALTDAGIISDAETENSRTLGEALGRCLLDLFQRGAFALKKRREE